MSKFADLHVHTRASDGEYTPEEAVEKAHKAELVAISIADHDTVNSVSEALEIGKKFGVEVIPGIELSSRMKGKEFHILGYFIDWRDEEFRDLLNTIQDARRQRARRMVKKLQELDLDITYDEVLEEAGDAKAICRPHIARVMLNQGYVKEFQGAFEQYIGNDGPAYVERYEMSTPDAIQTIRRIKGIPVLAHPIITQADETLPTLIKSGLQGIEVYHIKHDESVSKHYEKLAREHGLLVTGGTDAHGPECPIGKVRVPYELVKKLKTMHKTKS